MKDKLGNEIKVGDTLIAIFLSDLASMYYEIKRVMPTHVYLKMRIVDNDAWTDIGPISEEGLQRHLIKYPFNLPKTQQAIDSYRALAGFKFGEIYMSNKHVKYSPPCCGTDMFGNKVYEGDWYVHKNEQKALIYKASLTNSTCVIDHDTDPNSNNKVGYSYVVGTDQKELTWCAKYPKNLGKSEKAIKGFRKLCGWEA